MSILEIIFANFWTWAGTVVLVAVILGGLEGVIEAMRKPERTVRVTTYGDKTCIVQIDNATEADVHRAVNTFRAPEQVCDGWEDNGVPTKSVILRGEDEHRNERAASEQDEARDMEVVRTR